jgi:arylsulfatase A-like enzyme
MDIGPTVLDMFGVTVPGYMDGKPLTIADLEPDKGKAKTGSKDISHGRQ